MPKNKRLPWLTIVILVLCLAGSMAVFLNGELVNDYGFLSSAPAFSSAVTSLFLHENLIHLLGNMVFIAAVGPMVELAVGRIKFLLIFLLGGLAGVLGHYLIGGAGSVPSIGASGAAAACLGYCSIRYMNLKVPILPNVGVGIWAVAVLWATLQALAGAFRLGTEVGGTAYWAHLVGFLFGIIISFVFRAPKAASLEFGHAVLEEMNSRSPASALHAAEEHLVHHPNDNKAIAQRLEALHDMHEVDQEVDVRLELLRSGQTGFDAASVVRLCELNRLEELLPAERAKLADSLKADHPDESLMLLESLVGLADSDPARPDALLAMAEAVKTSQPDMSQELLNELNEKYALHGAADLARAKGLIQ
jgi:membrane associated rhomboid family serine protease